MPYFPPSVAGPASATDNAVVRFDLTTGKLIQNSTVTISDGGVITAPGLIVDTDALVVDTANNRVGIGIATPAEALHIVTADYATMRFDAASDGGFFYADGVFHFVVMGSRTATDVRYVRGSAEYITLTSGEIVLNETGASLDTRIEGDTDANLFVVDASADKIGIGNAAPAVKLDVTGEIRASVAGTNAASVVLVGGTQTLTNKTLGTVTISDAANIVLDTTTGTKIGTATTQKLAFFNATPIVQPANTTDLRTALINLGLYASGGATPLNLNGGALTNGQQTFAEAADMVFGTTTGTKIGTATNQKIGFFNATPIVRGTAFTQTYSTASHTHANITASNPPAGGTGATAGAYDTAANRNAMITSLTNNIADVANLKQVVNGLIDDLQALGLIA